MTAFVYPGKATRSSTTPSTGFGDSLAMNDGVQNVGIHFYRNEIRWTGDDAFEGDYGTRNITFYDNRVHNAMTLVSFDPIYGGPAFVFRNIAINVGRSPYKLNNKNTGHFLYNNTVVRTNGYRSGAGWGWNQSNNGPLTAWGYRNNILIYRGTGQSDGHGVRWPESDRLHAQRLVSGQERSGGPHLAVRFRTWRLRGPGLPATQTRLQREHQASRGLRDCGAKSVC